jgi:solute carrier family 50 protein (sugar transporter)
VLFGEVIFMAAIVVTTFLAFHTHEKRTLFVGVFCDIFNILMYASPLTIVVSLSSHPIPPAMACMA